MARLPHRTDPPSSKSRPSGQALRWVSDREPGLRREGPAGRFRYRQADGRPTRDIATLRRVRALAIPPGWREVWICADAQGHLQATGRDAAGRKQYLYHPQWRQQRSEHKFAQLPAFGRALPRLRSTLRRCLAGDPQPTRERVLAALVQLLDCTWMRIGNSSYARENGSYGLSTLLCRHLRLQGDALRLRFIGKTGVEHRLALSDPRLAAIVRRCRELPGQPLFQYLDDDGLPHRVDSSDVNAWLTARAGPGMTAKVFRTWHGSVFALDRVLDAALRDQPPDLPAIVREVAARLGNTPAVCRASYLHPAVLDLAVALADPDARARLRHSPWWAQRPRGRGLSQAEVRLMGLLAASSQASTSAQS